jgi:hypothetical protein
MSASERPHWSPEWPQGARCRPAAQAYGVGLRAAEVSALKVADLDSEQMLIEAERGPSSPIMNGIPPAAGARLP